MKLFFVRLSSFEQNRYSRWLVTVQGNEGDTEAVIKAREHLDPDGDWKLDNAYFVCNTTDIVCREVA